MSYIPIRVHASAPGPVREFIARHVDMQFNDVHTMLKLPQPRRGLHAGCHFATVGTLLSLVAGIATVFYRRTGSVVDGFVGVLRDYYPWDEERPGGLGKDAVPKRLYECYRNPLAHTLAVDSKQRGKGAGRVVYGAPPSLPTAVAKLALRETAVRALESGPTPAWLTPTLVESGGGQVLYVHALYRGARRVLEKLTEDGNQMLAAVEFLEESLGRRQPLPFGRKRGTGRGVGPTPHRRMH